MTIRADDVRNYPSRPPSEIEWEDLLLRLELMPKALAIQLEDAARIDAPPPADGLAALGHTLADLVERELKVQDFLERASSAPERPAHPPSAPPGRTTQSNAEYKDALDRFVRVRSRNFAIVQRRGIDVWDWEAEITPGRRATVFQVLAYLARTDAGTLARLRTGRRPGRRAC